MAAVNITSREEQFQSYKTEKDSPSSVSYYTSSDMANIGQTPTQYTTAKINNPMVTVASVSKTNSTSTESSTSEFVDYSEVKLIGNEKEGKNAVAKRARLRRKTTKKRDDECMLKRCSLLVLLLHCVSFIS